jgi:hypothetical protein
MWQTEQGERQGPDTFKWESGQGKENPYKKLREGDGCLGVMKPTPLSEYTLTENRWFS